MTGSAWRSLHTVLIGLLLPVGVAFAQESAGGAALYHKYNCHICHGKDGLGGVRSGYPTISGQDRHYLTQQITDIRDGVRENGQSKVMRAVIKKLSDTEIEAIANFLSSMP